MTVLITLTIAGADTGPFNLYSNVDGYVTPFESSVAKSALLAGYASVLVPDGTTIIRVLSQGECSNYIDIVIGGTTTTTSSSTSSTSSTTTTSTTTIAPEPIILCCANSNAVDAVCFTIEGPEGSESCATFGFFDCNNPAGCPV
jgi:hypothetical protein